MGKGAWLSNTQLHLESLWLRGLHYIPVEAVPAGRSAPGLCHNGCSPVTTSILTLLLPRLLFQEHFQRQLLEEE